MSQFEDLSVGLLRVNGGGQLGTLASVTGLSVLHKQVGPYVQSIFTLTDVAQAVVNGTEYQSTLLYTFPKGRISILDTTSTLAQKTTSTIASTIISGATSGAVALGSAAASNVSLTSTMVDVAPSTGFTSSTTINVAGTAVKPVLAAPAHFDGTTTASTIYLNSGYGTTSDVIGNGTQTFTGTIVVTWLNVGNF